VTHSRKFYKKVAQVSEVWHALFTQYHGMLRILTG